MLMLLTLALHCLTMAGNLYMLHTKPIGYEIKITFVTIEPLRLYE